jgi:hypothetical protein
MLTLTPPWRPTPEARMTVLSVRCFSMQVIELLGKAPHCNTT